MLSVLYGIAMARHRDFANPSFSQDTLPSCARQLFDAMFQSTAPHSTTHILMRDYAKHTIDIALLQNPSLFTEGEVRRLTPPFRDGGIHDWGREMDRNKGEYRYGNHPIDPLDDNPVEKLGFGSRYNPSAGSYRQGEEHLWWRIYHLGYSLERFGGVDKQLAALDSVHGGYRFERKIDHYGRKYCRIATLELAGLLDDLGKFDHMRDERRGRLPFVDIDPSFPSPLPEFFIVSEDFLGDREMPLHEWIQNGGVPDLHRYLIAGELNEQPGPWVLLDSYIAQDDSEAHRARHMNIRAFFVRDENVGTLLEYLPKQDFTFSRYWMPDVPWDTYRFAGEVPWCETYPPNDWTQLELVTATRIVETTKDELFILREGTELPLHEAGDIAGILALGPRAIDEAHAMIEETRAQIIVKKTPVQEEESDYETIEVLIPIREDHWEGHHSETNPSRFLATPARELTEHLAFCGQPQTFDLFEESGVVASLAFQWGDLNRTGHRMTYLRMSLLDRFLADNGLHLVWCIWGERRADFETASDRKDFQLTGLDEPYRTFAAVEHYPLKHDPNC
jgi:hypothetical protein